MPAPPNENSTFRDVPREFEFPVERGKVREFRQATLPLLRAAGIPDIDPDDDPILVPLVFSRVADFHHPEGASIAGLLDRPSSSLRHAGHSWQSARPLRVGSIYRVLGWTVTGRVEKQARDGRSFSLVTAERLFFDPTGEMMLREEAIVAALDDPGEGTPPMAAPPESNELAVGGVACWNADWRNVSPPDLLADLVVPAFGLIDFVRFAGAIGDFNAIHHDRDVAQANGLPDVIAMGMLNCALAAALAELAYGEALASLTVRFREPLFAGQPLRLQATAESAVAAKIEATSGGRSTFAARAVAR